MTADLLEQWRRDLLWAVTAPSPIRPQLAEMPAPGWFQEFAQSLRLDDWQPSEPPPCGKNGQIGTKVGFYFEWLWQQALQAHPDYQLLAANLPVMGHSRTLGALDLLVYNLRLKRHEHWELAIKFYLGLNNSSRFDHWIGPGLRDRFDIKWQRLCDHQLALSAHPAAKAALEPWNISRPTRRLILKGVFFCDQQTASLPTWLVNDTPPAQWITLSRFQAQDAMASAAAKEKRVFYLLAKPYWLALPPAARLAPPVEPAILHLPHGPVQLMEPCSRQRLFVVPDDWPSRALARLPDFGQ